MEPLHHRHRCHDCRFVVALCSVRNAIRESDGSRVGPGVECVTGKSAVVGTQLSGKHSVVTLGKVLIQDISLEFISFLCWMVKLPFVDGEQC